MCFTLYRTGYNEHDFQDLAEEIQSAMSPESLSLFTDSPGRAGRGEGTLPRCPWFCWWEGKAGGCSWSLWRFGALGIWATEGKEGKSASGFESTTRSGSYNNPAKDKECHRDKEDKRTPFRDRRR